MSGPSASRLTKAGGDPRVALASLDAEYRAGAPGWSPAQKAAYANPATHDAWAAQQIGQTTKGKFSGPLGAIGKVVTKVAPYALPLLPGLGPLGAGVISAGVGKLGGKSWKQSLTQGALTGGASALLGGQGYKGVDGVLDRAKSAVSAAGKTGLGKAIAKDPLKAATIGLAGLSAVQGAKRAGQADELINRATSNLPSFAAPERVNLDSIFADPNDPYRTGTGTPRKAAGNARYALAGG